MRGLLATLPAVRPATQVEHFATDKPEGNGMPGRLGAGMRLAQGLRSRLREDQPRLVHLCCGSDSGGWGLREATVHAELVARHGVPYIVHLHASGLDEFWRRRPIERPALRRLFEHAAAVATLSRGEEQRLLDRGVRPASTAVLRNGVEIGPAEPPHLTPPTDGAPLRLVLVGAVCDRKGIEDLLDALPRVRAARGALATVDVIGPSAVGAARLQRWSERGRNCGLRFTGPLAPDAVRQRLLECDGLVLPSRAEGQPFALLEAMALRRPVLATATGAVAELLDGGAGELVPPRDPEALAEAIVRWLDSPDRRGALADAGWQRVRERHALEHTTAAVAELWESVLSGRATATADASLGAIS